MLVRLRSTRVASGTLRTSTSPARPCSSRPGGVPSIAHGKPRLRRYGDHGVAVTGSIEVGVDFPQPREFKAFAQFADCEGTERDPVFVCLNLVAVLKDEHHMGDVLVVEALRYLPGVEHDAPAPRASYHPVGNLHDLALGVQLLPVTGVDHHVSPGTGHPPWPRKRLDYWVPTGGVHQRVPDTKHNVK